MTWSQVGQVSPGFGSAGAAATTGADATDALAVDGTAKPAGAAETTVAAAWDSVVQEIDNKLSVNAQR